MARSTHNRPFGAAILGFVLVLSSSVLNAVDTTLPSDEVLEIEPASTWAGIARVHLEIEELRVTGETLEGTYQIRVPLSPRQNDTGRLVLYANAATVTGSAVSSTGRVHEVVAHLQPNGVVRIQVATPEHTLHFKSKYTRR